MLIDALRAQLLLVDMQARLVPVVRSGGKLVERAVFLAEAAGILDVPVLATVQYPKGLGGNHERLEAILDPSRVFEKITFSAMREPAFAAAIAAAGRPQVVLCGMEAHVCVLQTAMELRQAGFEVFLVADATGSRTVESRELALRRMEAAGCTVVTSEMVVFEWLGRADSKAFKRLIGPIKNGVAASDAGNGEGNER